MSSRHSPLPAYAAATAGIGSFSIMDMVMKGMVLSTSTFATLLYRSLTGVVLTTVLVAFFRPARPSRSAFRLHLLRGAITAAMSYLFFWGLARVPMAQGVALSFIAPLIALVLAALILGEKLGRRAMFASLLALVGVVIIFVGQAQTDFGRPALLGSGAILTSAMIYAWNIVVMRQQALAARPVEIAFFQNLTVSLLMLLALPFAGLPALPSGHWPEIMLAALLATISQLLLAWAYARAGAAYLSSTEYSSFLWAMALGRLRFGEPVSLFTLAGAALIVTGCWFAARASEHPTLEASA
ncbi:MAG: DMT family transporter [Pseudomonadota bacterium]|nr:DMT family transporter [Pseudomonadota bacterium]